jgi:hypothetical protein
MEDLAEFFDPDDVITKSAIYTPAGGNAVKLYGQFDNGFANRFGVVEDLAPAFLCIASKVDGVAHGDAMTIDAVRLYGDRHRA